MDVLRYFVLHPHAADSFEGLVRWRVLEESIQRNVEEIDAALRWLLAQHLLVEESVAGTGPVFRLNRERVVEAERLVSTSAPMTRAG